LALPIWQSAILAILKEINRAGNGIIAIFSGQYYGVFTIPKAGGPPMAANTSPPPFSRLEAAGSAATQLSVAPPLLTRSLKPVA